VDALGFIPPDARGVIGAGCATRPADVVTSVQDATAGALRALQGLSGQSSRR
jgi:heterodisulfide reductase subunit A-like polyferredoxin